MSGPQVALLTLENAPRDVSQLAPMGLFQHRRLLNHLENAGVQLFDNDKDRSAFFGTSSEVRAQRLVAALQELDSQGGAPAPAPDRTPVQQPQAAPPPPQAVQQPVRTPVQSNGAAPVANGAGNPQVAVQLLQKLGALEAKIDGLSQQLQQVQAHNTSKIQDLGALLHGVLRVQEINTGLLTLFGEQVLQAQKEEFLPEAKTYSVAVMDFLGAEGKG